MKTIRYVNDYMYNSKGDVREEGDGVADILIRRNIAVEVQPGEAEDHAKAATKPQTRRIAGPRE